MQYQGIDRSRISDFRNNSTFHDLSVHARERSINDVNNFINDYSVRDRLKTLNSSQTSDNYQLNVQEMATFYAPSNFRSQIRSNPRSGSNFKLTLTVIMVSFLSNNKTITIDTDQ